MKFIISMVLSIRLFLSFSACTYWVGEELYKLDEDDQFDTPSYSEMEMSPESLGDDRDWVMYWYLCGSDLESDGGAASADLEEMMSVELPDNVKIVIQTGGSYWWDSSHVDADYTQRFVYDSDGLRLVEELPIENMGDPATLESFLQFAEENFPAEHTILNIWNHGGGSMYGVAFDEMFDMDSLTLPEMHDVFSSVYGDAPEEKPLDIIGFDACLMASIDTAYVSSDFADYMVASEELEPGLGWNYVGMMQAFVDYPGITALDLSKVICDTYMDDCQYYDMGHDITLSVIDLNAIDELYVAFENFGIEALSNVVEDPNFYTRFSKVANRIENYGGNTREQGYSNMADLGHMAENLSDIMPDTSAAVLSAIENCVVYNVTGEYRQNSNGIACYYTYDGDAQAMLEYNEVWPSEAFKHFYTYGLTGELPNDGLAYISEMEYIEYEQGEYQPEIPDDSPQDPTTEPDQPTYELPELESPTTMYDMGWEDMDLTVDDSGYAVMDLGPMAYDLLTAVTFELYYIDEDEDVIRSLGSDNDINGDWDNGIFKDNFRGVWGSLDGAICYMEIVYDGWDYNEYSVPILLNGEKYNLSVIYDFNIEEFFIMGARKPQDESGAIDKNLVELEVGDQVQLLHYSMTYWGEDTEFVEVPADVITVTENTSFYEGELSDGMYGMMFVMTDARGDYIYSDMAMFEVDGDDIYTTVE